MQITRAREQGLMYTPNLCCHLMNAFFKHKTLMQNAITVQNSKSVFLTLGQQQCLYIVNQYKIQLVMHH